MLEAAKSLYGRLRKRRIQGQNESTRVSAGDGPPVDIERPVLLGALALAFVLVSGVLWALLAPLDEGLVINGVVSAEGSRVPVQHPVGGVVAEIQAHEGDQVLEGDLLATLDSRQLSVELQSIEAQMVGVQRQLSGIREVMSLRTKQLSSLRQESETMERLVTSGYFAPSKLRDLERNLMDLRQQLVQAEQTKNGLENQLSELNARQFSTTRSLKQTEIRAPVSGAIVVSNINSSGVVIGAGDRVFEILPTNKRLIVEGQIPRHLARRLSVGTDVSLRFSSVQSKNSPNLEGELFFISPDTISQQQNAEPVFVVRAKVNGPGTDNPDYFQPGVPVEMLIRTGDHTLFEYLTKSIGDFLFRSLN